MKNNTNLHHRTDCWACGCLLYAWYYGYSPFECEFNANNTVRVVECTFSRVLSKIPCPPVMKEKDQYIIELVEWILNRDILKRPFSVDIINRLTNTDISSNDVIHKDYNIVL